MNKKKTDKKETPPVDSKSYVVDSLSKASSSIENAFNAINSVDYSSLTATGSTVFTTPTWSYGHYNSGNLNIPFGQTITNTPSSISQTTGYVIPYQDATNVYPKIDIEKVLLYLNPNPTYQYRITVYLAGVAKDRIQLNLEKGAYLGNVFHAPKLTVQIIAEKNNTQTTKDWFLKESKQSFTNRIINLPNDADVFNVSGAEMKDGILSFDLGINRNPEAPAEIVTLKIN